MDDKSALLIPGPAVEPISVPGRGAVPLTLLTGFLGAGKTTLLNNILAGDHGLRVGVLVNDFGAINIDAALVENVEENTISLVNGCVCCEIRDDLVDSLEALLIREEAVEYVIVEASGVADPAGIVMTFLDARYDQLLRLDSITCVIDAEGIFADADDEALNALKLRQIAFADLVVLNKADLVGPEHLEVIRDWIGLHLKRIRIVEATKGRVPLEILLGAGRFDASKLPESADESTSGHGPGDASAGEMFERWSFVTETPYSAQALERMVKRRLPGSVYRCKGIVFTEEQPDQPLALQVVGRRTSLTELPGRSGEGGPSEIVAIGRKIDRADLETLFTDCLAATPTPAAGRATTT